MSYATIKTLHILSMVLLFGTGLGSAYYKWMADRSGIVAHIAATNRQVVLADWLFTAPTVIIQPVTGLWMAKTIGLSPATPWLAASLVLYALAGACWLPVVVLQLRMQKIADAATDGKLPDRYWQLAGCWIWLGLPAFASMVCVVAMMVHKKLPWVLP